jgi:uncharacterized membrane protein
MLLTCPHCAAQMPDTAAFCPGCGRPMKKPVPNARPEAGLFAENAAGALAYLTFIPAILFLVLKPYKKKSFVRFHAVQCLLLWGAGIIIALALKLVSDLLFLIPAIGPLLWLLISAVVVLAVVLVWLVLVVKALQGERFKLPLLGEFAAEYAGESEP